MEGGVLQQFDTPQMIKERPSNLFTGTFVGEPPMNVFESSVVSGQDTVQFKLKNDTLLVYPASDFSPQVLSRLQEVKTVVIGIRPYAVQRDPNGVMAKVSANQWLGDQTHIAADFAGGSIVLVEHDRARLAKGEEISVHLPAGRLHMFDSNTGIAISHGGELA